MLGFGVYFAERSKAEEFARRKASWDEATGSRVGAVLVCRIDLGYCKLARGVPCQCGCAKKFVDHLGLWYAQQGYDSICVPDDSLPATKHVEWCVADPQRITVVEMIPVTLPTAAPK